MDMDTVLEMHHHPHTHNKSREWCWLVGWIHIYNLLDNQLLTCFYVLRDSGPRRRGRRAGVSIYFTIFHFCG